MTLPRSVSFDHAFPFWHKIGFISFGRLVVGKMAGLTLEVFGMNQQGRWNQNACGRFTPDLTGWSFFRQSKSDPT